MFDQITKELDAIAAARVEADFLRSLREPKENEK